MYKLAVIGARETVMGFKALGLDVYPVESTEEARIRLKALAEPEAGYAVIYIEETVAQYMAADIQKYTDRPTPAVILIPGRDGSLGLGLSALKDAVERAVGSSSIL